MKNSAGRKQIVAGTGAILSTLLFTGPGCGMLGNAEPHSTASPVPIQPAGVAHGFAVAKNPAPVPKWSDGPEASTPALTPTGVSAVNVFGEVEGVPRATQTANPSAKFEQHTTLDEGEDSDIAVDPTGQWMVFSSTRHIEGGDIYLQRVNGASVTRLTDDAARDAFPTFSPDGKWIAFSSTRSGNWQIYKMDLDGRNVAQITAGGMQAIHPSFSPDGNRIVYSALSARTQQWELWTADLTTGEKKQMGMGLFPTWSPDKSVDRIAFQRARQRGSRWFSLWTMELVEGEGRRDTEIAVSSNAAIVAPCWSPDGRQLAFSTVVQNAAANSTGQQDIWSVNVDGTNKHRLTDGTGSSLTPAWAADNRVYFVSNRGGNENIWSVKAPVSETLTAGAEDTVKPTGAEAHVETNEVAP